MDFSKEFDVLTKLGDDWRDYMAENAGGAHCLKYGFTVNHVLGARVVLDGGEVVDLGGPAPDAGGAAVC